MLERDHSGTVVVDYRVTVEVEKSKISVEQVARKLADSVSWTEGTGDVIVDVLGEVDTAELDE